MTHGNWLDDGLTCTTRDELQFKRDVRFNNGSGFDELDACAMSLGYETPFEGAEPTSDFDDPLQIIMAEEEDDQW